MKKLLLLLFSFLCVQCIPLRTAPQIKDFKVMKGKRLNKKLQRKMYYVFENHQRHFKFYDFLDEYVIPEDYMFYSNVPVAIDGETFYITFKEVEGKSEVVDLVTPFLGIMANEVVNSDVFGTNVNTYSSYENYIAIRVHHERDSDCLHKNSLYRPIVLKYLSTLKAHYRHDEESNSLSKAH